MAQEFGGNPPSLKWKQVNTPYTRVIYPRGLDSQGLRVARIAAYLHDKTTATSGSQTRKINIVLQNQTTTSNGYVGLAPWRSEFYLTPQFNSFRLGSLPWVDNLAMHEYRHVQQYMNYRKGLSKVAYFILGEEGQAVANAAAIPNWFFEGDAVFQETAVSGQGRGRLPYFFNGYQALWQQPKQYSFMKLRNGSLKDYIPDHYSMGYILSGYGREKYGEMFWEKVTNDAAGFKGFFYPFQKAVKRHAGVPYREFVQQAFDHFKNAHAFTSTTGATILTDTAANYVINYNLPHFAGDSILVLKNTYRHLPAWYWLINGREEKIRVKDIGADDYYSYSNGRVVYTAYEPDARWAQRDYSVIKILKIATGAVQQVTRRSKYFSPDISEDGKQVVAIQFLPSQRSALHILDAATGKLIRSFADSIGAYVHTYPKFYGSHSIISCVRNAEGMMSIALTDTESGHLQNLTAWSYNVVGYPRVKGDTVFYTASNGYKDDVYALDINSRNVFRLTDESTGAYQPAVSDKGQLVWSNTTANGSRLMQLQLQPQQWQPLMQTASIDAKNIYLPQALLQTGGNIMNDIPQQNFPVSKYSKWKTPFNIHSWRPYYEQPDWSFTVYGQNILNTFQSEGYYSYNENENSHKVGANALWGSWFPWITGGISYTMDRRARDTIRTIYWNEWNVNIGASVPLNFTRGRWYKNLTLSGSYNLEKLQVTGRYKDSLQSPFFNYLQFSVSWNSQIQKATQHINPRLAQSFLLRYRTIVNDYTANQLLASGTLYFPGIGINHSLVVSGAFQQRDTANRYYFGNNFPFARGYEAFDAPRMWKWAANYHFPIAYPDFGFGQLVYFLRVRGNLFFDYAQVQSLRTKQIFDFRSTGAEIYFDTKWWNQQPVSFGFRCSYLLDNNIVGPNRTGKLEFVLPVALF